MYDELQKVVNQRKGEGEALQKAQQESSRQRLLTILRKKLKTSFIGSIAEFEKFFGALWGHGKLPEELTQQERGFRDLWEECRTEVLDNGNDQIRAVEDEISQYSIMWNRHKLTLHSNRQGK